MFLSSTVFLFAFCAFGFANDDFDNYPEVKNCSVKCSKTHEDACQRGCLYAYALTFAPKDYKHNPSCADSCNDNFFHEDERAACIEGCGVFVSMGIEASPEEKKSFFSPLKEFTQKISNYFRQRFNDLFGNQEASSAAQYETGDGVPNRDLSGILQRVSAFVQKQQEMDPSEDGPVVSTHVRIILLHGPENGNVNPEFADSDEFSKSVELLAAPAGESDGLAPESERAVAYRRGTLCVRVMNGMHKIFKNPFNLLFALSLFALLLLLLAQIVMCVLRKPKRQVDSQYAHLPTYAEAVEIKIPLDMEDYGFKAGEKSKPASENPLA